MIDERWIKNRINAGEYVYSRHGDNERQQDNLFLKEVEEALRQGNVLEQYSDTGRGESCLVVGFTNTGKPVHIVCGGTDDRVIVITVYIPKPPKFKTPYSRGD